jgi:hypothetical protein
MIFWLDRRVRPFLSEWRVDNRSWLVERLFEYPTTPF